MLATLRRPAEPPAAGAARPIAGPSRSPYPFPEPIRLSDDFARPGLGPELPELPESAGAIARAVRERRFTARQAVERSLRRIRERDGELRAFLVVRAEEARAEARALDRRDDLETLPLAGVPIAVKDNLDVEGVPTTGGALVTPRTPAARDAEIVARLRAAGAIVVGKTTLPELGIWATTDGFWGVTRNPRAPDRTPGGSSGGSAAAVAAGMVPLALGNDGLGSIRIPAACCGVAGLKLSRGATPVGLAGGDWNGLAVNGPLARTVDDVALAAAVMAGAGLDSGEPDGAGPARLDGGAARPDGGPGASKAGERLRIAVSVGSPIAWGSVDPEWEAATLAAADRLRARGHEVVRAELPYGVLDAVPVFALWFAGVADSVDALVPAGDRSRLERRTRVHARLGRGVRRLGGPRERGRERIRRRFERFLADYDAVLTPALATPPPEAARWAERSWFANMDANARYAPFAAIWNLLGTPAGVVPVGTHSDGTPLAVQAVTGRGADLTALGLMAELEAAFERP